MQPPVTPPDSIDTLMQRAGQIAGLPLGVLAELANIQVPKDFKREKGWTGQLIELWLGATAGSKPQQDFPHLGVELKTIPIDDAGKPLETTYVCYAPLTDVAGLRWQNSNVRNKLSKVLWFPVQGSRQIPPAQRQLASPLLWSPNQSQVSRLQQDWEELMDMIALGNIAQITARHGEVLQLRPKAADGSALTEAVGKDGQRTQTRPRGFYLRKSFTAEILENAFAM